MRTLHLFNPENDIALAAGTANFTPPKNARMIASAGALLPMWLAEKGDAVLLTRSAVEANPGYNDIVRRNNELFGLGVDATLSAGNFGNFEPWGWSRYARDVFRRHGAADILPGDNLLDTRRELSHRRLATELNLLLREKLSFPIPPPAREITDISCPDFLDTNCSYYFKSPWSSSGRGVFSVKSSVLPKFRERISGIIRSQGSVMVEKELPRIRDFAMLFSNKSGKWKFAGYSLFSNNGNAYAGNILAPDYILRKELAKLVPGHQLLELEETIPPLLATLLQGNYTGNLGIDMMIYHDSCKNIPAIAPTIEINLRNTMGFVAVGLRDKLLHPDTTGIFTIEYTGGNMSPAPPGPAPVIRDMRLCKGEYLPIGNPIGFKFKVTVD